MHDFPPPPRGAADAPIVEPPLPSSTPMLVPAAGSEDAVRLRRLLWLFALLAAVPIVPYVIGQIQYAVTSAQERARLDVAREHLGDLRLVQLNDAHRLLANAVQPSVVSVRTHRRIGHGQGSGVIVDEEGYIVTNYHVVEGVRSVEIELSDGRHGSASVVGVDPDFDLAVVKTELGNLTPAKWGDSDALHAGEMVWALGSPFGLRKTITQGIVSATEHRNIMSNPRSQRITEFVQTDAAVNPGNSGGPLVNINGEVVGINTAIIGESYQGVSFAIPSKLAQESYAAIRRDGHVIRGYLGVAPAQVPRDYALKLGLAEHQGVLVALVDANTPAADAGLRPGDVILTWNGVAYYDPTLLRQAIATTPIGSEAIVEIVRPGDDGAEQITLEVTVGARPRVVP